MDIHRCRFVEFPPAAINALAFSHSHGSIGRQNPLRLAIGRANGNIEIWDPRNGAWIHETTMHGGKDRSVEGLAWVQEPDTTTEDGYTVHGKLRLFSIGYSSNVTEWNLITGLPLRQSSGSHSEVWCLTAQPRLSEDEREQESGYKGQNIVAGCADGTLILLSTADDSLDFQKRIARPSKKTARALSITFRNRHTVVAGFADSTIRVYDIRNGNLLRAISLGAGPRNGPKEILVWAVECLKDGTIVSADSTGQVCFWDGKTYGQLQRIKGHEADALCLATSEDGKTILSGGMDRRTVAYTLATTPGERNRWTKTAHRRFHKHDIKAMARFENKKMSVVVSGGLDTQPIITPLREFGNEFHRTLPYNAQRPPVRSAGRLLVSWWANEVNIWRLAHRKSQDEDLAFGDQVPSYKLVSRLLLKSEEHISCAAISQVGSILAVGTASEVRLFELRRRTGLRQHELKVRKIDLPAKLLNVGVRAVEISPDSQWLLIVTLDNKIFLHCISYGGEESIVVEEAIPLKRQEHEQRSQNPLNGEWGSYDRIINQATFSWDSRLIATSDLCGFIDIWRLGSERGSKWGSNGRMPSDSSEDSGSQSDSESESESESNSNSKSNGKSNLAKDLNWYHLSKNLTLPQLPTHALILSFRPPTLPLSDAPSEDVQYKLLIVTATHEIYEYSALHGRLTDWSRRNPPSGLPDDFKKQKERVMGCFWDVMSSKERIWLYGATWVCMFDLRQDFPPVSNNPSGVINGLSEGGALVKNKTAPILQGGHKRKRGQRVFPASGAGDRIPDEEVRGGLASRSIKKVDPEGGDGEWIDIEEIRRAQDGTANAAANGDRDVDMGEDDNIDGTDGNNSSVELSELQKLRKSTAMLEEKALQQQQQQQFRRQNKGSDIEMSDVESAADTDANPHPNGEEPNGVEPVSSSSAVVKKSSQQQPQPRKAFYITNKYRPILGIVPLSSTSSAFSSSSDHDGARQEQEHSRRKHALALTNGANGASGPNGEQHDHDGDDEEDEEDEDGEEGEEKYPEVALIERPFGDLDLPPRFVGNQEWER